MKRKSRQSTQTLPATPWPGDPAHRGDPPSILCTIYLIVASKTWTVESLSNETVLITNLTAFWNSEEFPIIFKKRKRTVTAAWSGTEAVRWRGRAASPECLRVLCLPWQQKHEG